MCLYVDALYAVQMIECDTGLSISLVLSQERIPKHRCCAWTDVQARGLNCVLITEGDMESQACHILCVFPSLCLFFSICKKIIRTLKKLNSNVKQSDHYDYNKAITV